LPEIKPGRRNYSNFTSYLYVTPAVALVVGFIIVPIVFVIITSFTDWDIIRPMNFVGLKNYINFFKDPIIITSLKNTFMVVALVLAIPMVAGLVLAVFIKNVWFSKGFKSIFYIPIAMSGAGIGIIWKWFYSRTGFVNGILVNLGILDEPRSFLIEIPLNVILVIFAIAWQSTGINMILFLMGLQNIPTEILEASKIDGATDRQNFFYMILPLLKPITTVIIILNIIGSFKVFDIIWVMTGGGPYRGSETLAVSMFKTSFALQKFGYGSAIAVILSLFVFLVGIGYMRVAGRGRR
jgi:ABC-type sugar transport system permease subunit